jgi:hypothetical protein
MAADQLFGTKKSTLVGTVGRKDIRTGSELISTILPRRTRIGRTSILSSSSESNYFALAQIFLEDRSFPDRPMAQENRDRRSSPSQIDDRLQSGHVGCETVSLPTDDHSVQKRLEVLFLFLIDLSNTRFSMGARSNSRSSFVHSR